MPNPLPTIPIEIFYAVAALIGGALLGFVIARLIYNGRRAAADAQKAAAEAQLSARAEELAKLNDEYRRLSEKYMETANALSAANTSLEHLQAAEARLQEKDGEIRRLNAQLADAGARRAELEKIIENQEQAAEEKSAMFEDMRNRMVETFSSLSARALQENNQSFLDLAKTTFSKYFDAARNDVDSRTRAMREFVQPLLDSLQQYDQQVRAMEQARQNAYGGLAEQVDSLAKTQQALQRETGKLVGALRLPHVRGRWGELTLRRVVEIAGMQNHCDFYEQPTADDKDGSTVRPDMVVRLPDNRQIVIDAKVPITAYLDALEAESGDESQQLLARHAGQVQQHIGKLARKSYWAHFTPTPEFVVLFMPGENFFSAALSQMPSLIEEGAAKGVILATPTTLISLLKTVAYAWRQEAAVENARAVSELGNALYSRIYSMVEHINRLGRDLDRCVGSYNRTVGSLERRVLVSARKFSEMGAVHNDQQELDAPEPVDGKTRRMDWESDDQDDEEATG